ncbi:MAG: metallophosphoesterase family protein [Sarcina sp.]
MAKYVVSDIHNNWERFKQLLDIVNFSKDDTLIINGDLIDRGVRVRPFIKFLKEYKNQLIYILGNHEQMFIDACQTEHIFDDLIKVELNSSLFGGEEGKVEKWINENEICNLWLCNGGDKTLDFLLREDVEWLYDYYTRECRYYEFIDGNLFVHAGLPLENVYYIIEEIEYLVAGTDKESLIWDREFFDKYCIKKETKDMTIPCNIFVGHNSMVSKNLDFKKVTETKFKNGYKIIATDMSDITRKDSSMMLYSLDTSEAYIARKGKIIKYKYSDEVGVNELQEIQQVGKYVYLGAVNKK